MTLFHNVLEVGCAGGELTWVVDQVSTYSNMHSIGVFFLRLVIHDDSCVCDSSVFWDGDDLLMCEYYNRVCPWCVRGHNTLSKIAKFLSKCPLPQNSQ